MASYPRVCCVVAVFRHAIQGLVSLGPQVVAILEAGQPLPFRVKAANLDLPELQGEPADIAKEKCRLASEKVHPSQALD